MKKKNLTLRHRLVCALPYVVLHWLITENLLSQYCDNTVEYIRKYMTNRNDLDGFIGFLEKELRKSKPEITNQYIDWAFVWDETIEGYNFWYRRSNWLKDYLK